MRFVFLGTGTSAGVPMIGCSCAVCTSGDPRDQRLRTAAALQWMDASGQQRTVLLDASPDLRVQALKAGLTRCDAIFFTHNHVDHVFGLDEVRRFNVVMNAPIDIYADRHTMDSLERIYRHVFERHRNVNDSFVASLIPHRIEEERVAAGEVFTVHGMRFTPVPLLHGRLPILGYRIEPSPALAEAWTKRNDTAAWERVFPLAYCTDVSGFPPRAWARLTGLSTLVLDALRHRAHPTHLTLEQAVHAAEEIGAGRTYFVHMAHDLPHGATQEALPPTMHLAHDGLSLGPGLASVS